MREVNKKRKTRSDATVNKRSTRNSPLAKSKMPKDRNNSKSKRKLSPSKSAMVMKEPEEQTVDSEADTDVDGAESGDDRDSLPDISLTLDLEDSNSPVLPPAPKKARRRIDSDSESSPLSEVLAKEGRTASSSSTSKNVSSTSKKIKTEVKSKKSDASYKYEPRQCPVCKKWFVSEFSFSAHMETHSVGEKKRSEPKKSKSPQKKSGGESKNFRIEELVVNVNALNTNLLNVNDLKRYEDWKKRKAVPSGDDEVKIRGLDEAAKELIAKQESELAKLRKELDREKAEQEKKSQQIVELEKETKNSKLSSNTLISELEAKLKDEREKSKSNIDSQVLVLKQEKEKLEKANNSLNLKIEAYNNKNNSLKKEKEKHESENKELKKQQEKFQKIEAENQEIKKSLEEKTIKIKKLNHEKARVDSDLSSRKNESEDRQKQIEILKEELEKLQNESQKIQDQNSVSSSTAAVENSEEFEKLKKENSKYAKTDNTLREAIKKLQSQLKDKRAELTMKDEKIQRLEKEQKENQNVDNMPNEDEKIKEFRRREIEKQQQLEKIEEENLKLIQEKTKDSREILAEIKKRQGIESEMAELKKRTDKQSLEIGNIKMENSRLKDQLQQKESEVKDNESKLNSLLKKIELNDEQIKSFNEVGHEKIQNLEAELKEAKNSLSKQKEQLEKDHKSELQQRLDTQKELLEKDIAVYKKIKSEYEVKIQALDKKVTDKNYELEAKKLDIKELNEMLDNSKVKYEKKIAVGEAKHQDLSDKISQTTRDLIGFLREKRAEIPEVKGESGVMEYLTTAIKTLKTHAENAEKNAKEVSANNDNSDLAAETWKAKVEDYKEIMKGLEKNCEALQKEKNKAVEDNKKVTEALNVENSMMKTSISKLEEDLNEQQVRNKKLETDLKMNDTSREKLKNDLKNSDSDREILKKQVENLTEELNKSDSERENLKEQVEKQKEILKIQKEVQGKSDPQTSCKNCEDMKSQLNNFKKEQNIQTESLKQELAEIKTENEELLEVEQKFEQLQQLMSTLTKRTKRKVQTPETEQPSTSTTEQQSTTLPTVNVNIRNSIEKVIEEECPPPASTDNQSIPESTARNEYRPARILPKPSTSSSAPTSTPSTSGPVIESVVSINQNPEFSGILLVPPQTHVPPEMTVPLSLSQIQERQQQQELLALAQREEQQQQQALLKQQQEQQMLIKQQQQQALLRQQQERQALANQQEQSRAQQQQQQQQAFAQQQQQARMQQQPSQPRTQQQFVVQQPPPARTQQQFAVQQQHTPQQVQEAQQQLQQIQQLKVQRTQQEIQQIQQLKQQQSGGRFFPPQISIPEVPRSYPGQVLQQPQRTPSPSTRGPTPPTTSRPHIGPRPSPMAPRQGPSTMMAIGPGATLHGPSSTAHISANDLVPAQRTGGIRLSQNLFAQNPPKPKSVWEVKEEAFLQKLRGFQNQNVDVEIFKPFKDKWYQELDEEFSQNADDELMEFFCEQLCVQDNLKPTEDQKVVLRIMVNVMFLRKFHNCPDNPDLCPWTKV